jgi:hypothetical protein
MLPGLTGHDERMAAGYSGTPLVTKLGIVGAQRVSLIDEPAELRALLEPLPRDLTVSTNLRSRADVVVLFVTARRDLERRIGAAERAIFPRGGCWIAWPKRASGIATDMTEDVVRAVCLPRGLVDNKVCAIDGTWSGLRVVWRRERRTTLPT